MSSENGRVTGKVKFFSPEKGFGFAVIDGDEAAGDVFLHFSQIQMDGYRKLNEGEPVEFTINEGPKGRYAENIVPTSRVRAGK